MGKSKTPNLLFKGARYGEKGQREGKGVIKGPIFKEGRVKSQRIVEIVLLKRLMYTRTYTSGS